jgi:predicted permease
VWLTRLLLRVRATLSKGHDRELRDELHLHLRLLEEEYAAQGLSRDEARQRARREFGNAAAFQETSHDLFSFRLIEDVIQDLRYAIRETRRSAGFTCVAVTSLAVGIGALTTTFSIIDAFMLRGLPVHDADRLAAVSTAESLDWESWPYAAFTLWREPSERLFDVAAASPVTGYDVQPVGSDKPNEVRVTLVSGNYFEVIGADIELGRALTETDDSPRATEPVVVISHAFWHRWFGRTPDILTKTIDLQGRSYAVVGVAAKGFRGHVVGQPADIWVPLVRQPELMPGSPNVLEGRAALETRWLSVLGRLRAGIGIREASVWVNLIHQRFVLLKVTELGESNSDVARDRKEVVSLLSASTGFAPERAVYARPIMILSGITFLVFLVACANFTNLMVARTERRRREFAIRLALGGGRGRLIRQSMAECALLAVIAGTLGLLLAEWTTTAALKQFAAMIIPIELSLELDARILSFAAASVVVAAAFGLLPCLRQVRSAAGSAVYQTTHAYGCGRTRGIAGRLVLIAQMAMCAILLMEAGLLLRTVMNLRSQELGFDRNVLLVSVSPRRARYPDDAAAMLVKRITERLSAVPGIQAVGVSGPGLLDITNYWVDDSQLLSTDYGIALPGTHWTVASVGPNFFNAVGISMLHGRGFNDQDAGPPHDAIVINRALATSLYGNENPLGRRLRMNPRGPMLSVVGVVSDAKQTSPRDRGIGVIYTPMQGYGAVVLAVRTAGLPSDLAPVIAHQIGSLATDLPIEKVRTIAEVLDAAIAQERLMSGIALVLAALVIAVGCVGLYALMSYDVAQRTHELGVRLTLGATGGSVATLILRDGVKLVFPALMIGIPVGVIASRPLSSQLYGVASTDPWTLTSVALVLTVFAFVATVRPALTAARIDPIALLRNE